MHEVRFSDEHITLRIHCFNYKNIYLYFEVLLFLEISENALNI